MVELLMWWLLVGFAGAYLQCVIQGGTLRNPIAVFFDFIAVTVIVGLFIIIWPVVVLASFLVCHDERAE